MRALLVTAAVALSLTACGNGGGSPSSDKVAIGSGDTTCDVATTSFAKGDVTFAVNNSGKDVTEVYVYAKGSSGAFDKVVGEVENIAPGTSRDFSVDLGGGAYEVACKPGQKGDGIRTAISVAGKSAAASSSYDAEVEVTATDYALKGLAGFTAKAGDKVEFKLKNNSTTHEHELEVFGPDGKAVGEVGPTKPGATGEVILTLAKAGTYTYECGIADHASRGMKGSFVVS